MYGRRNLKRYGVLAAIAIVSAVTGVMMMTSSSASTFVAHIEAESGAVSGEASAQADGSASGNEMVRFGDASPTPCQGPLTITSGGTYGGCRESEDSGAPAVIIKTTQPVTLDKMVVHHAGVGVEHGVSGINVTISNSTFTAHTPTEPGAEQQAVRLYQPASLVAEHNSFKYGHGVQVNGEDMQTVPFRISYNDFLDISRLSIPDLYQGAVHTDKVSAPGGRILWNRVINHHGFSHAEDVFGLASTWGASGNPIEVAHNLVNGAYPMTGDGAGFTGGAFDFADITGAHIDGHHNYAVNYTNNGFMIPAGTTIRHRSSVAVYDGIADDGQRVSSTFGNGFTTYQGYDTPAVDIGMIDTRSAHRRWTGSTWERADYYLPFGSNSGNASLTSADSATEQAVIDEFEQSVLANGVTIGPLP